jgi:hypothetical protein
MITAHRQLLRQKEDLYEVLESFRIEYFYNDEKLLKQELFDAWKGHLSADIVLKNDSRFFFCKKIEDIEFEMVNTDVLLPIEA